MWGGGGGRGEGGGTGTRANGSPNAKAAGMLSTSLGLRHN
jgi:hypothetical protein